MRRIGRSTFRKLYWLPLLGLLFMSFLLTVVTAPCQGTELESAGAAAVTLAVGAFWAWAIVGRPIARLLVPLFVSSITCPGCQEDIDARGVWSCGCGFHDHRERHLLGFTCPKCEKKSGWVDCPRCSATILLW